jgi:hypothetical protein
VLLMVPTSYGHDTEMHMQPRIRLFTFQKQLTHGV